MLIVDRIVEGTVVCEADGGKMVELPLSSFQGKVHEGDVLREENGVYSADPEETKKRREKIIALQRKLFE